MTATWCVAVALGLAAGAPAGAAAQESENPLADALAQGKAAAGLPTPEQAMDAYSALDRWVREWAAPERVETPASAVRVTLWQAGAAAGGATVLAEDAGDIGPLAAAAAEAMDQARRTLLPRAGADVAALLPELGRGLTRSLELAGPMTPLGRAELLAPGATLRPGLDGVAARVGDRWAVAFPTELVDGAAAVDVRLAAMAADLLGDPALGVELLVDLAGGRGVRFYRFETVHVASVGPGGAPRFLTRGDVVVERSEVTGAGLVRFAAGLIGHLEAARIEGEEPLGIRGTLHASRGIAEQPVATPTQQALAALALARAAKTERLPEATRAEARELALAIMTDLAEVAPGEMDLATDGAAAALAWVVLDDLGIGPEGEGEGELPALRREVEGMLAAHASAEPSEPRASVADAVLVWALAERAARTGRDRDVAERELRGLYRAAPEGGLVGLTPWIGWAELALAAGGDQVPAGPSLRDLRDRVWRHQLTLEDTGQAERDLLGGVVFTGGGLSLPTWNTARPAALFATMLGDPRLTTAAEAPGQTLRLIDAFRFLQQLAVGEAAGAFCPRPDLAAGGVRAAAWDPRQPPEATALALLATCEFLRSIEALERAAERAESPAKTGADARASDARSR